MLQQTKGHRHALSPHTISVIGCGHVGTSCAYAILQNHLAGEFVLIPFVTYPAGTS
jgi:malate/lactate dehydrogenase